MLDPGRRTRSGEDVLIPVVDRPGLRDIVAQAGASLEEDPGLEPRVGRRTPREEALSILGTAGLPADLLRLVPDRWERLGDVLVLRIPAALRPHAREVAAAFTATLDVRCVVEDAGGVSGELREMRGRILFGEDPVGTIVENGIRYTLDATRVMFSSGNVEERRRAGEVRAQGETVVDMFAGIGYFAIPLAKRAGAARVIAVEKNPVSFEYLKRNVAENGVETVVEPVLGDNRDLRPEGIADRVLMGYFPGTAAFLPKAFALLKPTGGRIHYHDTAHERRWKEEMTANVLGAARACGRVIAIEESRVVKTHSPGVVHAVLVVRVTGA